MCLKTMGMYFKVCIRFLCVSDTTKVSLDILQADPYDSEKSDADNVALWKEKIKPYYEAVKANVKNIVHRYKHEGKSYHSLVNILVPNWYELSVHKKSNVLSLSNWADGRYDMSVCYTITFYDRYGQVLDTVKKIPTCEINRFMILLPENSHSIRYTISRGEESRNDYNDYTNIHFFNFKKKCVTCEENGDNISSSSDCSSTVTFGENDESIIDDDDDDDDDNNCTSAEVESIEEDVSELGGFYDSESRSNFEFNSESL
jgi:hypothetical protein